MDYGRVREWKMICLVWLCLIVLALLPGPLSGASWQFVNDNSSSIQYSGGWSTGSGQFGDYHYTDNVGATATFSFYGTKVRFYGYRRPDNGKAEVFIDGSKVCDVIATDEIPSIASASPGQFYYQANLMLFESRDLPAGNHTVMVRAAGLSGEYPNNGSRFDIAAFEYRNGPADSYPGLILYDRVIGEGFSHTLNGVDINGHAAPVHFFRRTKIYYMDREPYLWPTVYDISYIHFASDGPVDIDIEAGYPIRSYDISPHRYGISGSVDGNTLSLASVQPQKLMILLNHKEIILVYHEALETDAPNPDDSDVVNLRDYVDGYGSTLQTSEIQQAIDNSSAAGKTLYVPRGYYRAGTLYLKNNTTMYLEPGAKIRASNEADDLMGTAKAFIYMTDQSNIRIYGRGVIANCGDTIKKQPPKYGVNILKSLNCSNLDFEDVILWDAAGWNVWMIRATDLTITNLKIISDWNISTTDGIDLDRTTRATVDDCMIFSGDDCIAVLNGTEAGLPGNTQDLTVKNSLFWTSRAGIKIWASWETGHYYRNLTFQNNTALWVDRGIATWLYEGSATLEDVTVTDYYIENIVPHIYKKNFMFELRPTSYGCSYTSNIHFYNTTCERFSPEPSQIQGCSPSSPIEDIHFHNLMIDGEYRTTLADAAIVVNNGSNITIDVTNPPVEAPQFSPSGGLYNNPVDVSVTCGTSGATIYYTTDGSNPTESSSVYSSPIHLSSDATLKARAYKSGMDPSSIATASYTIDASPPSVPGVPETGTVTANSIELTWTAATDNKDVAGYTVYRNGSESAIGQTPSEDYTDHTVLACQTYYYSVRAYDAAGNESAPSADSDNVYTPAGSQDADFDDDGDVDPFDFAVLAAHWLMTNTPGCETGDLDADGDVDLADYFILALAWDRNMAQTNIITNGSFEDGAGWPAGWSQPGGFSWDNTVSHSGMRSLKVTLSSSGDPYSQQSSVNLTPGDSYRLSGWMKSNTITGPTGCGLSIRWVDLGGGSTGTPGTWNDRVRDTQDWTYREVTFTVNGGTGAGRVDCQGWMDSGSGWFDDVVLTDQ